MRRGLRLLLAGCLLILAGCLLAQAVQTADGVKIRDVRFAGAAGQSMSGLLYIPKNASPQTPAPGVLAVHGYINSRETQSGFAIEYARRGYVVLALDQTGHGYSRGKAFSSGFGGPDGLDYLLGLPFVDKANIALEGHSMGGGAILAAALARPDAYKAMVLEGSATATLFSPPGDSRFPRNLAVVFSRYDEFSRLMWGVDKAADVTASPKLAALFGRAGPVRTGVVYGDISRGDARILYTPATTHPGDHLSPEAIGDSIEWLQGVLVGGTPRPASDQIWMWKEAGTGLALIGFVLLTLGAFDLLAALPWFDRLNASAAAPPSNTSVGRGWWIRFALATLLPALTYLPSVRLAAIVLPPSIVLPQGVSNQIVAWAVVNTLLTLGLATLAGRRAAWPRPALLGRAAVLAATCAALAYAVVAMAGYFFHLDFRFWVTAVKVPSPPQLAAALIYTPFFLVFFLSAFTNWQASLLVAGQARTRQYLGGIALFTAGFALLIASLYVPLFAVGQTWAAPGFDPATGAQALFMVVALNFLPILAVVGLTMVFAWRRTGGPEAGAVLCALFVSLQMAASQATHAWG